MIRCPECNAVLIIPHDAEVWDHLFCQACGAELEIIALDPPEVELAYDGFEPAPDDETSPDEEPWEAEEETEEADEEEPLYPWETP